MNLWAAGKMPATLGLSFIGAVLGLIVGSLIAGGLARPVACARFPRSSTPSACGSVTLITFVRYWNQDRVLDAGAPVCPPNDALYPCGAFQEEPAA